jgi:hypothetical protein
MQQAVLPNIYNLLRVWAATVAILARCGIPWRLVFRSALLKMMVRGHLLSLRILRPRMSHSPPPPAVLRAAVAKNTVKIIHRFTAISQWTKWDWKWQSLMMAKDFLSKFAAAGNTFSAAAFPELLCYEIIFWQLWTYLSLRNDFHLGLATIHAARTTEKFLGQSMAFNWLMALGPSFRYRHFLYAFQS